MGRKLLDRLGSKSYRTRGALEDTDSEAVGMVQAFQRIKFI